MNARRLCAGRCREALLLGLLALPGAARANVVLDGSDDCPPLITFSEVKPYTSNPQITAGGKTVSFGTIFVGQTLGKDPNTLIDSSPSAPLQLDASGPSVATMLDLANRANMPVLGGYSGTTAFTTPIAILFSDPVSSLSFDLGHLDAAGTTTIEVFDANANSLGKFTNTQSGIERIHIKDDKNLSVIKGISIYVEPGQMDWEGFAIDNLGFKMGQPIPEPSMFVIWSLLALIAVPLSVRNRRS